MQFVFVFSHQLLWTEESLLSSRDMEGSDFQGHNSGTNLQVPEDMASAFDDSTSSEAFQDFTLLRDVVNEVLLVGGDCHGGTGVHQSFRDVIFNTQEPQGSKGRDKVAQEAFERSNMLVKVRPFI